MSYVTINIEEQEALSESIFLGSEWTKPGLLVAKIRKDQQVLDKTDQEVDTEDPVAPVADTSKPADGKLIVAEEIQLGHVGASALEMHLLAMGGKYPILFFALFLGGLFFNETFVAFRTWELGYWARQYDLFPADQVDVVFYLAALVAIVTIGTIALMAVFIYLVYGQLRASKIIHTNLMESILSAPLRLNPLYVRQRDAHFFSVLRYIPNHRWVTNDVRTIDDSLPGQFWGLGSMIVSMLIKLIVMVIYTPLFFFPGALVGLLGAWIAQIYISGQLPDRRFRVRVTDDFEVQALAHQRTPRSCAHLAWQASTRTNVGKLEQEQARIGKPALRTRSKTSRDWYTTHNDIDSAPETPGASTRPTTINRKFKDAVARYNIESSKKA
ncbi:hypothetical protein B0H16DRAFT_1464065 [Mycena metata]|uniref:Uncharacterized protein n=1 Tax=Mycena metata TaxID=1033252 RepID=A0AAD7N2A4_9AGAR|nr:hypothetical protein B0H16DRAFT_1464065 [Mycena metata]